MIIFLDTNIVVYFIGNPAGFGPRPVHHLGQLRAAGHSFAVSDLVRMECRVHPIRHNDMQRLSQFDAFFTAVGVQVFSLTTAVCDGATLLRAAHNFKTADSLQLAAAIVHGCDRFLTSDARLARCTDIPIDQLP